MKLSDMMKGITPDPSYKGVDIPDKIVLAINPQKQGTTTFGDFVVFRQLINNISPNYESEKTESTYYYDGTSTVKTGTKVTIPVDGERYIGDEAQDLAIDNIFSTGNEAIFEAVWFNINTGIGKAGYFTIDVSQHEGGEMGDNTPFSAELSKTGIVPVKFNFNEDKAKTFEELVGSEG